jgi:nicotinamidase-related amidase
MGKGLFPYPLTAKTVHLCLDMQRIFAPGGPWATPWMERVLPVVASIASRFPERTVFTRFITPHSPLDMPGMWQRYYSRWRETTRDRINPVLLELLPPLSRLSPPATIIDKTKFSAFAEPQLFSHLQARDADGLVITGSETDVCVLGTVLGAVDVGYRVIIARDAICSSSDEGHDALMEVYHSRFSEQIETANADEILDAWS